MPVKISNQLRNAMNMKFGIIATNNYVNDPFSERSNFLTNKMTQGCLLAPELMAEVLNIGILDFNQI